MRFAKTLFFSLYFGVSLYAIDITSFAQDSLSKNKMRLLTKQLSVRYPDIASRLNDIQKELESKKSVDSVYFFVSSSVPISSIELFIKQASILNYYYGTKSLIVFQGLTDQEYEQKMIELRDTLSNYEFAELFFSNFTRIIDPKIFKTLNLTKVPALGFGVHNGNPYPSKANIKYLARGDISLDDFFSLIIQKDKQYEAYHNSILATN